MDGMDLNAILTDRITLEDLLYRKRATHLKPATSI